MLVAGEPARTIRTDPVAAPARHRHRLPFGRQTDPQHPTVRRTLNVYVDQASALWSMPVSDACKVRVPSFENVTGVSNATAP